MHHLCEEQISTVGGGFNQDPPYGDSGTSDSLKDLLRDWSKPMPVTNDAPTAR